jgi:integrase
MAKKTLDDRFIKSPNRVPATGRKDYQDALVPGLALRVTTAGHRSFVLVARYPLHPKHPTRRALGDCYTPPLSKDPAPALPPRDVRNGALTLAEARDKAREWIDLIRRGVDPKIEEARQRAAALRQQTNTFAAVAAEFLDRHVKGPAYVKLEQEAQKLRAGQPKITKKEAFATVCADPTNRALVDRFKQEGISKKDEAIRAIETDFVKRWGARPITDILPDECAAAIRAVAKRGAPYEAHNRLGHLRRMFSWAIGTHEFGITASPVERLSPKDLIGKREARERTLTDDELRAIWNKAGGRLDAGAVIEARSRDPKRAKEAEELIGYPYGPLFRLLILTGQREREVADMTWSEVDFDAALWTIPAGRMKGDRAHEVPLAPQALALLRALPRFTAGDHVFTTTDGTKPVNGFSKAKVRIDKLSGVDGWKFHDLRRTMRTHLSALPVQDMVRELVIAHAKQGLHKVYDLHSYQDEKRECLTLWEARLRGILTPKEGKVVTLRGAKDSALEQVA